MNFYIKFIIKISILSLVLLLGCREKTHPDDLRPDKALAVRAILKGENRTFHVGQAISIHFMEETQSGHRLEHFSFESALGGTISYVGKTYSAGERIPIDEGADLTVAYKAAERGQTTLYFKFIAEGFKPLHLSVPLRVEEAEPPFRVVPLFTAGEPIYVGRVGEIHFKIEHKPGRGPERFSFEGTDGNSIRYAGQSYKPGETIAIDTDETQLKVGFVPEKAGHRALRFKFMADDFVDSVTVALETQYPFRVSIHSKGFDSLPDRGRFYTVLKTTIGLLIEPVSGIPAQAKYFYFQSALGGTLTYAKKAYKADEEIEIDAQEPYMWVDYRPAKTGQQDLHFYFTEGSGKPLELTLPLTVTAVPVSLDVKKNGWKSNWLRFEVKVDIPRGMSQLEDDYQWRYKREEDGLQDELYFLGGDEKITPDQSYPLKHMRFEYGAHEVGKQTLTFTVTGPYGHEHSIEVPITIPAPIPDTDQ